MRRLVSLLSRLGLIVMLTGGARMHAQQPMQAAYDALQQQLAGPVAAKDYKTMESLTRAQITLIPTSAEAHYNLACALAMQGRKDEALQTLTKSAAFGFSDAALLDTDPDLASLRDMPAFAAVKAVVALATRSPAPGAAPAPAAPPAPIAGASKIGAKVQGLWRGQWWPATVTAEKDGQYFVRYDGGSASTDEWLTPDKIAFPEPDGLPGPGSQVKVEWNGSWYDARVQKREGNQWRVNYYGYPASSDEWVPLARMKNKDGSAIQGNANAAVPAATMPAPPPLPLPTVPAPAGAAAPPVAGGGGLDWVYIETKILPKNLGGNSFMPYRLMANGVVARGGTQMDLTASASFNYAASAAADPHYFGHWARQGSEMVLTFEGGTVRKFKIEDAAPAPKLLPLVRAGKLPQGHGLSGKYIGQKGMFGTDKYQDWAAMAAAIWFELDGTMRMTKQTTVAAGSEGGGFVQGTTGGGELVGTYEVSDWVLTYHLGGKTTQVVGYTYDLESTGATPPVIGFMSTTFKRADKQK